MDATSRVGRTSWHNLQKWKAQLKAFLKMRLKETMKALSKFSKDMARDIEEYFKNATRNRRRRHSIHDGKTDLPLIDHILSRPAREATGELLP